MMSAAHAPHELLKADVAVSLLDRDTIGPAGQQFHWLLMGNVTRGCCRIDQSLLGKLHAHQ